MSRPTENEKTLTQPKSPITTAGTKMAIEENYALNVKFLFLIQMKPNDVRSLHILDSPAKAASQALQGLKQQLQQQHNELQRQRQSQERASSELGFYGNQQQVTSFVNKLVEELL